MDLPEVPKVEVGELLKHADAGEPVLLLDVRNDADFARWKLEGRKPLDTVHVPYFAFIEDEDQALAKWSVPTINCRVRQPVSPPGFVPLGPWALGLVLHAWLRGVVETSPILPDQTSS